MDRGRKKRRAAGNRANPQQPLISVCMIVKNEEAVLDRCLKSVRGIADEIVVVDTGSQDRTVEIAVRHGAKVSHFAWRDDFAAARNAALDSASGSWILQLDADEELVRLSRPQIVRFLNTAPPQCGGFFIAVRSHLLKNGASSQTIGYRLLLFRNDPSLRYRGRIHESVRYVGDGPQPDYGRLTGPTIEHHGYMPDVVEKKAKEERNLRLLQLAISEDPNDPFQHYNLGLQYATAERYGEAIAPLRRAAALCPDPAPDYLLKGYALLLLGLGRAELGQEVEATIAEAERRFSELSPDYYCNAGEALRLVGQFDWAMTYFERAIRSGQTPLTVESDPAASTWLPHLGLSMICDARGELQSAETYAEKASALAPGRPEIAWQMAKVKARLEQPARALQQIKLALKVEDLPERIALGLLDLCETLGDVAKAGKAALPELDEVAGELLGRIVPSAETGVKLSEICRRFNQFELGIAAANAAMARGESAVARINRGYCYFALGRYQEAADDFAAAEGMTDGNSLCFPATDPDQLNIGTGELPGALATMDLDQVLAVLQDQEDGLIRRDPKHGLEQDPLGDDAARPSPLASIIITVGNGVDHLRRCVEALIEHTPEDFYELVIVDNASKAGTADFLALLSGDVKVVANETNIGTVEAHNLGAQAAEGQYLIFLRHDAEPQAGWLEGLIAAAGRTDYAGLVGAKLLDAKGNPLPAGGFVASDGPAEFRDENLALDQAQDSEREVDYCCPGAWAIRQELWQAVGGLDRGYASEDYAVKDLCFALRQDGRRVLVQPASTVICPEGPAYPILDAALLASGDRQRFTARWSTAGHERTIDWALSSSSGQNGAAPSSRVDRQLPRSTGETATGQAAPGGYYQFARPEIQALVPVSAYHILDVGCAGGALGKALKARQACEITGIEYVAEVAKMARSVLDRVHVGDVNEIAPMLPEGHFDCIILADVLEHLPNPEMTLSMLVPKLAVGGSLVLSVPNVRHWSVVRALLEGRWDYEGAGLLDRTHLRFFTRHSIEKLLNSSLLRPRRVSVTRIPSEPVPGLVTDALREAGLDVSTLNEEGEVYQYLYVAEPVTQNRDRPLTSIIVLVHNQVEQTRICLASIERHTPERHELIIVDNGSIDETPEFLRTYVASHKYVRVLTNSNNRGFAAGSNQGLAVARGDYVLLLNNDTAVTDGWLRRMLSVFARHPSTGIVGPMSNYVSGPQLVPEARYRTLSEMEVFASRWARKHAEQSTAFPRVVGFCLMASRAVVERIGGLDERFGSGNFEDDDFCIRAALSGFEARIARDVFIHHTGSQTFKGAGIDFRQSMLRNWELFKRKWNIPAGQQLEDGYSISHRPEQLSQLYVPLPQPSPFLDLGSSGHETTRPNGDSRQTKKALIRCAEG